VATSNRVTQGLSATKGLAATKNLVASQGLVATKDLAAGANKNVLQKKVSFSSFSFF